MVVEDKMWNAVATGAAVSAVTAAKPVIAQVWRLAFGADPPGNPADPEVSWRTAILWAVVTGALIGVVRLLAQRAAAGAWHRATGHYPEALAETRA